MLVVIYVNVQQELNKNVFKKVSINSKNGVGGWVTQGGVKETMLYDVKGNDANQQNVGNAKMEGWGQARVKLG